MQVLQAVNWMRMYIPCFIEVKTPQEALMDERLAGRPRTKHVPKQKPLVSEHSTPERVLSWEIVRCTSWCN